MAHTPDMEPTNHGQARLKGQKGTILGEKNSYDKQG